MSYKIVFTKQAAKDFENVLSSPFKSKVAHLLQILEDNPLQPPYEKLVGDLDGAYSRRINLQHRLIYRIDENEQRIVIIRMWTHYGDN